MSGVACRCLSPCADPARHESFKPFSPLRPPPLDLGAQLEAFVPGGFGAAAEPHARIE